jgi:NAD(P)-dependent dehydrogenase (short-subunit alcohol dehydrogenase family)
MFRLPRLPWELEMPADRSPSVLITGIHSAQGFAISYRFRKAGWFVIGTDQGTTTGRNARVHITADLTQEEDCRRVATRAAALGNGIDCIVNCTDIRLDGPVEEFGSGAWDVMMDVNAKSVFLLATAAMPYLEDLHGSIAAVVPSLHHPAGPEHAVYDATRAALVALMASLQTELAEHGIQVRLIQSDRDGRPVSIDEVADEVWAFAGFDREGHELSFAHDH